MTILNTTKESASDRGYEAGKAIREALDGLWGLLPYPSVLSWIVLVLLVAVLFLWVRWISHKASP